MKFRNEPYIFFVGANDKNEGIIFEDDPAKNIIVEEAQRCPPNCDGSSSLI